MSAQIRILDNRRRGYFATNDQYIDNGYAAICGWKATLVYMSLCRHANQRTQEAFPTIDTMAKEHGVDRKRIIEGIKTLIDWNLLEVKKERKKTGEFQKNTYILIDVKYWKEVNNQVPYRDADQVPERDTKEHNDIKEHSKLLTTRKLVVNNLSEIDAEQLAVDEVVVTETEPMLVASSPTPQTAVNRLMQELYKINRSLNFGDHIERGFAVKIIKTYGEEETLFMAQAAAAARGQPYAPTITKPSELWEKYSSLQNFLLRNQKSKKSDVLVL